MSNVIFQKSLLIRWLLHFILWVYWGVLITSLVYPHTHGLETNAVLVLEEHDTWAYRTVYLAGAAFVIQLLAQFKWKMRWIKMTVFVISLLAGISASVTGH